jgi:nickel-dependent lactate racemase
MIKILLPYGEKKIEVSIPSRNLMGVFSPKNIQTALPEEQLIKEAISKPIGTPALRKMVKPGMNVLIISDDHTRPTPVKKIIPFLLSELKAGGVEDSQISVIFALGTHKPMSETEMRERVGGISEIIRLYNSEFRDPRSLAYCGKAPDGVPVTVDKRVAEADFKIGIGSIIPHPECGWGGGAKIIYPGVASEETVTAFHLSYSQVDWNTYGSDKAPVRLNMEKWVDSVGLNFIVNTVVTPENKVYKVVAGDYIKAHRRGITYGRRIYSVTLPQKADIVLITSFRADEDFWLASKAIFAGELVIEDGGTLILVSPCPDGLGPHPEFADYVGCDEWEELMKKALAGKISQPIAVSSAVAMAKMRKRFDVSIVSGGLSAGEVERMGYQYFLSIEEAVQTALKKHGDRAQIAVLPYGISTLPEVRAGSCE